eukprot:CAMPEP_0173265020 /NCGR_PEP_ID=MMETSP1142-20121109/28320_1 /TAXON_ID=483371 /ORGANISM="non described non described, Strain CCMP2298" /LENGTH=110 /DNA_ID=CAMNT_0014200667 /DNA_START=302 /DNA_END=634 /DNA_ORIENTATION=-
MYWCCCAAAAVATAATAADANAATPSDAAASIPCPLCPMPPVSRQSHGCVQRRHDLGPDYPQPHPDDSAAKSESQEKGNSPSRLAWEGLRACGHNEGPQNARHGANGVSQ